MLSQINFCSVLFAMLAQASLFQSYYRFDPRGQRVDILANKRCENFLAGDIARTLMRELLRGNLNQSILRRHTLGVIHVKKTTTKKNNLVLSLSG